MLKLTSNPNRLRILLYLRDEKSSDGEVETTLALKQRNLSHELRKLRNYGLGTTRKQSKRVFYPLSDGCIVGFVYGLVKWQKKMMGIQMEARSSACNEKKPPNDKNTEYTTMKPGHGECGQFTIAHDLT